MISPGGRSSLPRSRSRFRDFSRPRRLWPRRGLPRADVACPRPLSHGFSTYSFCPQVVRLAPSMGPRARRSLAVLAVVRSTCDLFDLCPTSDGYAWIGRARPQRRLTGCYRASHALPDVSTSSSSPRLLCETRHVVCRPLCARANTRALRDSFPCSCMALIGSEAGGMSLPGWSGRFCSPYLSGCWYFANGEHPPIPRIIPGPLIFLLLVRARTHVATVWVLVSRRSRRCESPWRVLLHRELPLRVHCRVVLVVGRPWRQGLIRSRSLWCHRVPGTALFAS